MTPPDTFASATGRRPRYEAAETAVLVALGTVSRHEAETWAIRGLAERQAGISYDRAQAAIRRLVEQGRLVRVKRGTYRLPDDSEYRRRRP